MLLISAGTAMGLCPLSIESGSGAAFTRSGARGVINSRILPWGRGRVNATTLFIVHAENKPRRALRVSYSRVARWRRWSGMDLCVWKIEASRLPKASVESLIFLRQTRDGRCTKPPDGKKGISFLDGIDSVWRLKILPSGTLYDPLSPGFMRGELI